MPHQVEDRYDAIIIGAGIGGLTCGCYLAKAGMKVLIVEQHDKPGGCCTSFTRNGVTFDAAVHTLASCREGGLLGQVLDELDLRDEVELVRMDPSDVIITEGYEIPIKADLRETIDLLSTLFPAESKNIKGFFNYLDSFNSKTYYNYLKLGNMRFGDFLQNSFNSKKLISILSVLLLYTGVPSYESSALICFCAYKQLLDTGYYPIKGMQGFSDAFAKKFIKLGGTILFSSKVEKIKLENGEVRGVYLKDNEQILSKYVISNCDARQTFLKLIGREYLNQNFVSEINRLIATPSFFTTYLGLNSPLPRDSKRNGVIWYFPKKDINENFSEVFYDREPYLREGVICVLPPIHRIPLNNGVKELVYISVTAGYRSRNYWKDNKERVANELIKRAEEIYPGLSSSIVLRSIGTPYDLERYTLNYQGATNGWACVPKQVSFPLIKKNSKIKRLYLIGHWVNQAFGGGIAAVSNMGRDVAKLVQYKE